ncbi:aldolase/citrate lyase family protein [Algicella marina]|uniref:Aldolase n=1 Tax=Algicella marina TaxID=2683284 RepID=A0A6P1T7Y7_9RHOB|nr:aldolase/citrate lyase family protein [Algicella marina]QHQ36702.1 aldolase [Algicella marina]
MNLRTLMVVSDPAISAYVAAHGVDRLFVDLEWMGKAERQPGDTWKSRLTPEGVSAIRNAAPEAEMMVRVNPFHEGTHTEVDDAIARGADVLMLPMFRDAETVARFRDMVAGRAGIMPLVETKSALGAMPEIAALAPESLYIGLNDLHLDLGMKFMFQPLADGMLDDPCASLRAAGVPFGIGGIARVGQGAIPAEMVLAEHARLGSEWVILSRGFHDRAASVSDLEMQGFGAAVQALKDYAAALTGADDLDRRHDEFTRTVGDLVARL